MMEQTYCMLKPEILAAPEQRIGVILGMLNNNGFRITAMAMRQLDRATVQEFYAEHAGKEFFGRLVEYISSGPVLAMRLEREDGVAQLRELIGSTDPAQAAAGTVRRLYGTSLTQNGIHASANLEDSARELRIIFGE
ncbi:MAG: nucleoside-diphosphate kinase [bacterium]